MSTALIATILIILYSKNKKLIKKLLVLKWTKFHVKLRNFYCYGLIQVSYIKKRVNNKLRGLASDIEFKLLRTGCPIAHATILKNFLSLLERVIHPVLIFINWLGIHVLPNVSKGHFTHSKVATTFF